MKIAIIILIGFFSIGPVNAQRMAERMIIFNPLLNENNDVTGGQTRWINSVSGWGEFGKFLYSEDEKHAWYQKVGTFMEFFRVSDKQSLSIIGNIEFIADPDNDIKFNPRAVFWEEGFVYSVRDDKNFWQAGYYHRCKHDVDNLDYGTERSLIYGSFMGKYIHSVEYKNETMGYASLRGDFYTILQDYRKPEPAKETEPILTDLSFSLTANLNFKKLLTGITGVYFSSFGQTNFFSGRQGFFKKLFSPSEVNFNWGVETGIYFTGNSRFNLALRYEYFRDTGLNIYPEASNLFSFGVSLQPLEIW